MEYDCAAGYHRHMSEVLVEALQSATHISCQRSSIFADIQKEYPNLHEVSEEVVWQESVLSDESVLQRICTGFKNETAF